MTHLWSFLETIPNMKCTYSYSKDFLIYVFERALKGIIKPYPACQAAFHRSLDRVARWGHEVVKFGRGPLNWCDLRWCYCISLQSHDIFLCAYHCITVIWCVSDLCGIWWFVKCVWLYGAHFPTYVQLKHDPSKEPLQRPRKAGKHGGWKNPHMVRHPRNLMWRFNMLWMRMEKVGKWFLKRIRFDSWEYVISIRIYMCIYIYIHILYKYTQTWNLLRAWSTVGDR